jgi:MarR family 2-MHQ and catechol resistance regulon transcriptional repressor
MKQIYRGNKKEARALRTYVKLMRAAETVTTRIHRHLSTLGLTLSQFGVLEALYHIGPLSQRELGQKLFRSSGNVTMVIDNLEKRALVRRERKADDRRYFIVHLTDEGYDLIDTIFPPHANVITNEMCVLEAAEQDALASLCKKLGLKGGM